MNIPPPYCPKYLRVIWVTDQYGKVSPSCLPITNKDITKEIADKKVLTNIIGITLAFWLIILGFIFVKYKLKDHSLRRRKKIVNAYPYSRFAPHYI